MQATFLYSFGERVPRRPGGTIYVGEVVSECLKSDHKNDSVDLVKLIEEINQESFFG